MFSIAGAAAKKDGRQDIIEQDLEYAKSIISLKQEAVQADSEQQNTKLKKSPAQRKKA
jgi:hypothetical protein